MKLSTLAMVLGLSTCFGAWEVRAVTMPADTDACKDCAFPLRVDHGRWLMPNGQIEIEIAEDPYDQNSVRVLVTLKDARTKTLLASGSTIRPNFKNNFTIDLIDRQGKIIHGQIRWINKLKEEIQAKFTCADRCTIKNQLN